MTEYNCCSLEMSQKLVEAGIVLETDCLWMEKINSKYYQLIHKASCVYDYGHYIPAPSMAELWRELPDGITIKKWDGKLLIIDNDGVNFNSNPADALAGLLIWVNGDKKCQIYGFLLVGLLD